MAVVFPNPATNGQIVTDTATGIRFRYASASNTWTKLASLPGFLVQTLAIATNGQTSFTLPIMPTDASRMSLNVNGVDYFQPDFTVAGTAVSWAGPITLATTDKLVAVYP